MQREFKIKINETLSLALTLFLPENPVGIVQIIHGLREHRKRYFEFAEFLRSNNYIVILSDNRAHGESIDREYFLGHMKNEQEILNDQIKISHHIKQMFPNLPLTLLGHSFGSMIARLYIQTTASKLLDKLILSGTVNPKTISKVGAVINFPFSIFAKEKISYFLNKSSMNKNDNWVVDNPDALDKYRKDQLCNFSYTNLGAKSIINANLRLLTVLKSNSNPELKILSISGSLDPITGGEKGLKKSLKILTKSGFKNIENKVYENMKHEVLNEKDRNKVYQDVLNFINS